jgi:hypothetical protein
MEDRTQRVLDRAEVRRRALRAALAVTLGAALPGVVGCASSVGPSLSDAAQEAANAADVGEASVAPADASLSADAGAADATPGDAGETCNAVQGTPEWTACCNRIGWDWRRGCEAWGPFVPPAMEA